MKKIEIMAPCVCRGRNMNEGLLIDPAELKPGDLAVLIGSGLAREVDRYEIPEADIHTEKRVITAKRGRKK